MNLNDSHIVWICNIMEKISKLWLIQWQKTKKVKIKSISTPKYRFRRGGKRARFGNKKKYQYKEPKSLQWETLDLSKNPDITDKQIGLLLSKINKYALKLEEVDLSGSKVSNQSIWSIFKSKSNITVCLRDCEGITEKCLYKYPRMQPGYPYLTNKAYYCHSKIIWSMTGKYKAKSDNKDKKKYKFNLSETGIIDNGETRWSSQDWDGFDKIEISAVSNKAPELSSMQDW